MNTERSLETTLAPVAARRLGTKGLLIAVAGAVLLLSGCVAYEREDHYYHDRGRPGWGGHHYNHFNGYHDRGGWRR